MASTGPHIKAAVDLDGVVYLVPPDPAKMAPFLMLASVGDQVRPITSGRSLLEIASASSPEAGMSPAWGVAQEAAIGFTRSNVAGLASVLAASGNLYAIDACSHMECMEAGLLFGTRWLRELAQIGGQTEPSRCPEVVSAVTLAFFDSHLKRQANTGVAVLEHSSRNSSTSRSISGADPRPVYKEQPADSVP